MNTVDGLAHMTSPKCTIPGLLETKVSDFNATLYSQYLKIFTTKSFVVSEYDKPWISPAIKSLIKDAVSPLLLW